MNGSEYIWKLSRNCQDTQLYEAYMEKKVRRLHGATLGLNEDEKGGERDEASSA
jgi:hypothetical protein